MYVYTRKQVKLVLQVLITSITCPFQMLLKDEDGEGVRNSMNSDTSFFSCDENLKWRIVNHLCGINGCY